MRTHAPHRGTQRLDPSALFNRHSTASLLTSTNLVYATKAGITAAAGTRLAL